MKDATSKVTKTTTVRGRTYKISAAATGSEDIDIEVLLLNGSDTEIGRLAGRIPRPSLHAVALSLTALAGITGGPRAPGSGNKRIDELRKTYPNAYQPWTDEDDQQLAKLYGDGTSIKDLSTAFGRRTGAIVARLAVLGQIEAAVPPRKPPSRPSPTAALPTAAVPDRPASTGGEMDPPF
ncbi:hypothetical protein ACQP00_15140 [Dactylosporangium sp. CS-047395]|uniref:hypothetical protein n=1 Tax=Dactylosporangium sp. CS-047395 TaxID=3239936 RepID=UPI003D94C2A8